MEVVGTVGRYRGRQAFMNTDFTFMEGNMLGNNIYNRLNREIVLLSVTKTSSGVGSCKI